MRKDSWNTCRQNTIPCNNVSHNHVLWIVGHQLQSCRRFRLIGQGILTGQSLKNFEDNQQESKNQKKRKINIRTKQTKVQFNFVNYVAFKSRRNICRIFHFTTFFSAENYTWRSCTERQTLLSTCPSLLAPHQWTAKAIMRHHLVHPVFIFLCRCSCAPQKPAQPWLVNHILTHSIKEFLDCRKPRKCQQSGSVWMTHMR